MISVVIPTYNDENLIASTIQSLKENAYTRLLKEIIVVDAGSSDKTVSEARKAGATVIQSIRKNKACLFNLGVQNATGKILYFLTPGSVPPKNFTNEIVRATQQGYFFGSFRVKFNGAHWLLNGLSWLARKSKKFARLENQSLFVMQELFVKGGGFREDLKIMEDLEFINRLKRFSRFIVLKDAIFASAHKYFCNGVFRTELAYQLTRMMFEFGYPQEKLIKISEKLLTRKPKPVRNEKVLSASFN